MVLQFNRVILHNFGSYQHAEIDLQNKGFCLVSGENRHKQDNAKSNGSGKSFIWSGICFAITGETIQGLKSNLKNIYNDEEEAYVTLEFLSDKVQYVITRIIAPKSDLKITKDGIDVSGKGIRESETKLAELLPDLTQDLIASTIIIGQGMPNKFSAFKPAGRKELLEKLTKSDFMIADMKARIEARRLVLDTKIRALDDELLINNTKANTYLATLKKLQEQISSAVRPDFDSLITELNNKLEAGSTSITEQTAKIGAQDQIIEKTNTKLLEKSNEKAAKMAELTEAYNKATGEHKITKSSLETELRGVEAEFKKFKNSPDTCPTCGQKLPNVEHIKHEAEVRETKIKTINESLVTVNAELSKMDKTNEDYLKTIKATFDADIVTLNAELTAARAELTRLKNGLNILNKTQETMRAELAEATHKKDTWDKDLADKTRTSAELATIIKDLGEAIKQDGEAKLGLEEHLLRVRQLDTLTKRDFRGYILADIIKYIDKKAKDFSEHVFGHRDLNIYLDGNNLDISFSGKMFDSLSGGEKTRVDLIIQFAIRNLLITYLNINSNILVLDEITDFLDQTSCDAIMGLVEKELKTIESVFIISHHSDELNLPVDSELKVIKDETGISTIV